MSGRALHHRRRLRDRIRAGRARRRRRRPRARDRGPSVPQRRHRRAPAGARRGRRPRPGLGAPGPERLPRDVPAGRPPARRRSRRSIPAQVIGIGIDFTACTMLPTTADGTPLCFLDAYRRDPHAWVKLWKHHAAQPEADDDQPRRARARRAVARPLRRQDLVRVVLPEGAPDPARGARRSTRPPTASSRPPTGSSGS